MGSILKFSIINSKNISWESDQLLVFLVENNRPSQYFKKWQSLTGNNLNNIIDLNFYPTPKTKLTNFKHRPIGIGVQGLADVFFKSSRY